MCYLLKFCGITYLFAKYEQIVVPLPSDQFFRCVRFTHSGLDWIAYYAGVTRSDPVLYASLCLMSMAAPEGGGDDGK